MEVEFGELVYVHRYGRGSWGKIRPYGSREELFFSFGRRTVAGIDNDGQAAFASREFRYLAPWPRRNNHFAFIRGADQRGRVRVHLAVHKDEWLSAVSEANRQKRKGKVFVRRAKARISV